MKIRPEPNFDVNMPPHNYCRFFTWATKTMGKAAIGPKKIGAEKLVLEIQMPAEQWRFPIFVRCRCLKA